MWFLALKTFGEGLEVDDHGPALGFWEIILSDHPGPAEPPGDGFKEVFIRGQRAGRGRTEFENAWAEVPGLRSNHHPGHSTAVAQRPMTYRTVLFIDYPTQFQRPTIGTGRLCPLLIGLGQPEHPEQGNPSHKHQHQRNCPVTRLFGGGTWEAAHHNFILLSTKLFDNIFSYTYIIP